MLAADKKVEELYLTRVSMENMSALQQLLAEALSESARYHTYMNRYRELKGRM